MLEKFYLEGSFKCMLFEKLQESLRSILFWILNIFWIPFLNIGNSCMVDFIVSLGKEAILSFGDHILQMSLLSSFYYYFFKTSERFATRWHLKSMWRRVLPLKGQRRPRTVRRLEFSEQCYLLTGGAEKHTQDYFETIGG